MSYFTISILGVLWVFIGCSVAQHKPFYEGVDSKEISFKTDDDITLYGDLITLDRNYPLILLFHQGGSNARAEYSTIISELVKHEFNVLAVDLRTGGQLYGSFNRTMYHMKNMRPSTYFDYCKAYPDLEATLSYAIDQNFTGPIIAWGSSFSATLAIQLAATNTGQLSGVLGFSPSSGGAMQNCIADAYIKELKLPMLILRPSSELQIESVQAQFDLAKEAGHQTYIATNGIHGSSMLVSNRADGSTEQTWQTVISFLNKIRNR